MKRWCCCAAVVPAAANVVCTVAARSLLNSRGRVHSCIPIVVLSPPRIIQFVALEITHVFTWHTRMHRPRLSQMEKLDVRLLLFRGCHIVESFRDNVIRHAIAAAASSSSKCKVIELLGLRCPAWLWLGGASPRNSFPDFATLNAQSMRSGARSGPTLAPWCTCEPPACPAVGLKK